VKSPLVGVTLLNHIVIGSVALGAVHALVNSDIVSALDALEVAIVILYAVHIPQR